MRHPRLVMLCLLTLAALACGREDQQAPPAAAGADQDAPHRDVPIGQELPIVREMIADQLGLDLEAVQQEMTFSQLGADDLDLVELTMEAEDGFGMAIRDEVVLQITATDSTEAALRRLTVKQFSEIVRISRMAAKAEAEGEKD